MFALVTNILKKETIQITDEKYRSIRNSIIVYIREKELENPGEENLGVKQKDIVESYMDSIAAVDTTEMDELSIELKIVKMVINKMIKSLHELIVIQEAPVPPDLDEDVRMLPPARGDGGEAPDVDGDETALELRASEEQNTKPKRKKPDVMERILGLNPNLPFE